MPTRGTAKFAIVAGDSAGQRAGTAVTATLVLARNATAAKHRHEREKVEKPHRFAARTQYRPLATVAQAVGTPALLTTSRQKCWSERLVDTTRTEKKPS